MKEKQFGFGIIGSGMIAHFHAKAIADISDAKLKMVYDSNKENAARFADRFNCKPCYSLEEMLSNGDIDIVCICTPSGIHLEPALACISAGKDCLVEKPLEITVERCDRIISAASASGVKVGAIFPSRFYTAEMELKEAIVQKRFGELVMGDAYVKWYRTPEYYKSGAWRGTWKIDGGGALMNQGIHSVDLLQWYMGPVVSVQAFSTRVKHKSIEVEDTIVAVIQFENGALGSIECSTAVYPGSRKRIEVRGTEGSAVLEEDQLVEWEFKEGREEDKEINKHKKSEFLSSAGASDPADIGYTGHKAQIEDMINAIRKGVDTSVTAEEGRKSVAIIEAIYKSAQTGRKIFLKLK